VRGNTRVRQARLRTARSASSLPTFRAMVMRSSIARCIFRRTGPTSGSSGSCIRACRCRLCDQTKTCDENDRTRDSRVCAIQVGCRRYRLRCWRHRTATTSSRQRLRAWGQQRSCVRSWGKRPPVAGTAADIARTRRSSDWKRLSAGAGTKGPRLHDWCYLELATSRPSHSTVQMMACGRAVY